MRRSILPRVTPLAAALALAACSPDAFTSPEPSDGYNVAADFAVPAPIGTARALIRDVPLDRDYTASVTVTNGSKGDALSIREAGFSLTIPPGSIPTGTVVSVTALAGNMVAYQFEPHGKRWRLPLHASQNLKSTNWYKLTKGALLEIGYFTGPQDVDPVACTVRVSEWLPAILGKTDLDFDLIHFSGYMVSSGRVEDNAP